MKKIFFCLLSIVALLMSCEVDDYLEKEDAPLKKTSFQPKTWQEQLEYAKSKSSLKTSTRADFGGINFVNYEYRGKIENRAEIHKVIDGLFSDNSVTIQYIDESNYELISMKDIRQNARDLGGEDPFSKIKRSLEDIVSIGMELIEIEWLYKGKTFHSTAIASNDHGGIIYDNIGHYLIERVETENKSAAIIAQSKPLIKTISEPDPGDETMKEFFLHDTGYNFYGIMVWTYTIDCFSFFNKEGFLCDRSLRAFGDNAIGWDCNADLHTIGGELDSSKFHEFAWAYAYGPSFTVTITWSGTEFTVVEGGTSAGKGTNVHRK